MEISTDDEEDVGFEDFSEDPHTHKKGEFFGCYLLVSRNPQYKGRTYVGFTVDPNRRIKQHNAGCHMGGARKTSGRGPWEMVLIVHGFPNDIAALRFEWAWQHPDRSRRLGKPVARKKAKETGLQHRFRVLTEMLSVGPWRRLPLTIRWLKQEYEILFPLEKQPPVHMPITYGLVGICKSKGLGEDSSVAGNGSGDEVLDRMDLVTVSSCCLCSRGAEDPSVLIQCYHRNCTMVSHMSCLAERLCEEDHIVPVNGSCPVCSRELLWGELVRSYKSTRDKGNMDPVACSQIITTTE